MAYDINYVLFDIFEGKINVSNYNDIKESYKIQEKSKKEKNIENLFEKFIKNNQENNTVNSDDFIAPQTFKN